jgi:hypothetical protein
MLLSSVQYEARRPADDSSPGDRDRLGEKYMRKIKYSVLIIVLVSVLLLESLARRMDLGPIASDLFITALAVAVFFAVFERSRERIVAFAVAGAAIVILWARHLTFAVQYQESLEAAHHVLQAAFLAFGVVVILRNLFEAAEVTRDDVLGTICGYMLAAGTWGNLYAVTAILVPDAFAISPDLRVAGDLPRSALFNYFSVVTLTTMGYGDITPTRSPATVLAMLEAIFGQFYIATVVAQLVGLRLAQALAPRQASTQRTED